MTDPFLAEIRVFAGNFAPTGWALCNGQLLSISQNTALFSLLGTMYGGDGRVTFGLPDLRNAIPMQQGQGPGLSARYQGQSGGSSTVTLLSSQMPGHTHTVGAVAGPGDTTSPADAVFAEALHGRVASPSYAPSADTVMSTAAVPAQGGGQPHNNLPPYLVVTYIIALQGIFPQRP